MKRLSILAFVLGLVLAACGGGGKDIGGGLRGLCDGKPCATSVPESPSPTPSKRPAASKPKVKPTPTASKKGKTNVWTIVIRDVNNGYEPRELRALVGDTIIFKNQDAATPNGHSFTGDKGEWDSKAIKPGGSWTWIIDIAPGRYLWHCELVPYLVGGPLEVLPAR